MFKLSDSVDELKIKAGNISMRLESLEKTKATHVKSGFFTGFSGHIFGAFTAASSSSIFHQNSSRSDSMRLAEQIDIERVKLNRIERRIETLLTTDSKKEVSCKK